MPESGGSIGGSKGERVVLGRNTPEGMVRFQWTGAEPDGMDDPDFAEACGAVWEGDCGGAPRGGGVAGGRTPRGAWGGFGGPGAGRGGWDAPVFAGPGGAVGEGDELVTYTPHPPRHNSRHWADEFLEDSD